MEESSEVEQMWAEDEDLSCPGPLFRVKVLVLGSPQSGKTSLVQRLLQGTPHPSKTDHTPTEGINVDLWTPFRTQGLQRLLTRKLTGEEHHLVLELWDTAGRQVCQAVHGLFLTARTLSVIVYDVNDDSAPETVVALYRMVQQKYSGSAVIVVANKADLGGHPRAATDMSQKVLSALLQHNEVCRQDIAKEIEDTKVLLRELHEVRDGDNDSWTRRPTGKKNSQLSLQPLEECTEQKLLQHHLTHLEQRLARAAGEAVIKTVTVSAVSGKVNSISGKGLDEFRRALLEAALNPASFPHCSSSTVSPTTVALYDHVLAMRERDLVVLPWQQFQDLVREEGREPLGANFEEDVVYLTDVGALAEFRVGRILFPSFSSSPQQQENSGNIKDVLAEAGEVTQTSDASAERYVCLHPALLASAICYCLIDDDKKSFRFEAGRFWPKDSGFKHPDPQMLCKVLEAIPQLGLVKECVLPLIWQEYSLDEEQMLYILHVLQGLGLLAHHCDQKKHCEGLALPDFPKLSVHRCYALTLLGLLPDNRPQLNWTAKPFVGDIQVTWSFHLHEHAGLLQRLLAVVLFLSRQCSNYRHLWRTGVLLRVGEASVCAEQQAEDKFSLACRVNGDELGREHEAMRMLWVTLAPFVLHVRHFLLRWSGLHFKETLLALGQQFYLDEKVDQEPELWLPAALSLWHRGKYMTFKEGDTEHELDIKLLFPFKSYTSVSSVEDWLKLVMSKTDVILSDASVTMTSSLPPISQEKALKRQSMRGSVRYHRKKKSVEVKWRLQEENNTPNTELLTAGKGGKPTGKEDNLFTPVTSLAPQGTDKEQGRVISAQEEQAEALRLASGFVAAILASAMADYVAQEAEGDQNGSKMVSTAQIAAARVTAEAALAVHIGDIEGAANAVIDAVKAIQESYPPSAKLETRKNRGPVQSKLCAIV